jgi:hypothetical protein
MVASDLIILRLHFISASWLHSGMSANTLKRIHIGNVICIKLRLLLVTSGLRKFDSTRRSFGRGILVFWSADGSKTNEDTGAGVFGYDTKRRFRFRLGQHNAEFQAEVRGIKACVVENTDRATRLETIIFYLAVKLQLEHLTVTRSTQNCSGIAINP